MSQKVAVPFMRRLALSFKSIAPGGGRHLAGKDAEGNLYFEKPDPNGGRYPRRTVELADPKLSEANYDDANISGTSIFFMKMNTRQTPPTLIEIQRDEARKQLTITRAKALDQAWQDRKAELALEQAEDRKFIMGVAAASRTSEASETPIVSTGATATPDSASLPDHDDDKREKSAARKQIEEREAARKSGFKPSVQQGDTFEPQTWSPVAARRRQK
ncbi:hypothetical protein BG004_005426 [Podila humilis]|nr:hypothetical protein BG004_005426 [Podila humilis]